MARRDWSTSNFLRYAGGLVTETPLTAACWARSSILSTNQTLVGLFTSGSAYNRKSFRLGIGSTDDIFTATANATGTSNSSSGGTIAADTWFHAAGVWTSPTDRASFLNGGNKGTNATSRIPSGIDRTSVGVGDGSSASNPTAPAGTGDIAEVGLWNIALTDAEVAVLATGVSPLLVRPANLVGYWPLIGKTAPEINYLDRTTVLSIQGSLSASVHPRVIMPRKTKAIMVPPAAVSGRIFKLAGFGGGLSGDARGLAG